MPQVINVGPAVFDVKVTRRTDNRLRVTIYENGSPADLTGDTVTFLVKTEAGGIVKVNRAMTLSTQSGATLGQATITLTKAELRDSGSPNDSLTSTVEWVFQVRRLHALLESAPIQGTLILGDTI